MTSTDPKTAAEVPVAETSPSLAAQVFVEAVRYHQAGQTAAAEALYRAIPVLNPRHAEAFYNLGVLLQGRGDLNPSAVAPHARER